MQGNPKFKAIEESFEGHEAGAVDGISRDTVIENVQQAMDEPDEPTKEHQIQLAGGDLPGFDDGADAVPFPDEPAPAANKQGKTIVFPKKKEKKASGGGMKNLLAKFGNVDKKMVFGSMAGLAGLAVCGFMAYELRAVHGRLARLEAAMARAKTDVQRLNSQASSGAGGAQSAQIAPLLDNLNQRIVRIDQRIAQMEQAPAAQAAAPAKAAKKVATKSKGADRQLASVKKGKSAKKRR